MIKVYLIVSLLTMTLIISCKAQNNNSKQKKMKTFDIETFNKNKTQNTYHFITKDSTVVEQRESNGVFIEIIKKKNSQLETQNRYFKNGKIKMEVLRYPNDFIIFLKEYDQEGNLITETDYDKPYLYTFEDILKFIEKREIDMNGYYFEIFRNIVDNKPMWSITWEKKNESSLKRVIIDGVTGDLIKEIDVSYPEG